MNQVVKNLACEWAKDNIRANAVAPWVTLTPLVEQVFLLSCFFFLTFRFKPYMLWEMGII